MKKLLLIILLAYTSIVGYSQTKIPTSEETWEYISTKLSLGTFYDHINPQFLLTVNVINYDNTPLEVGILEWKGITLIASGKDKKDEKSSIITITGKGYNCKSTEKASSDFIFKNKYFTKVDNQSTYPFQIKFSISQMSEQDIQKFIKALKHMALLSGASLIKEDLF